jgi:hypothetical protein
MKLTSFNFLVVLLPTLSTGCYLEHGHDDDRALPPRYAGEPEVQGIPCSYLVGEVTLSEYDGDNFSSSSFSFEYATQDSEITLNDYDLQYQGNLFTVNLAGGDASHIVDLGEVALADVPQTIDLARYETGAWGEHDDIPAVIGHTYFVRNQDDTGRTVGAFVVTGLEPGVRVSISWIRSIDPDVMIVPTECGG